MNVHSYGHLAKTNGFSLDCFLEQGISATIEFVEKNRLPAGELGALNAVPERLSGTYFSGRPHDEAYTLAHKLWRPVYWYLFMDDVARVRHPKKPAITLYLVEREALIGEKPGAKNTKRNGLSYKIVRNDVLERFLEDSFSSGKTLSEFLKDEIRKNYDSLFTGIMKRHGLF